MSTYHCSLSAINPTGSEKRHGISTWLLELLKEKADREFVMNPYESVSAFFAEQKLTMPKGAWRLTKSRAGSFRGCPKSQGILVATNGVLAYVETGTGVFLGHLDNFEPMEIEFEQPERKPSARRQSTRWTEYE